MRAATPSPETRRKHLPETTYPFAIERDGEEIELALEADYTAPERGNRRGHPDTWSPDFAEEIRIAGIYCADGVTPWTGTLTADEESDAEQALADAIHNEQESAAEDAAEAWADAQMDRGEW